MKQLVSTEAHIREADADTLVEYYNNCTAWVKEYEWDNEVKNFIPIIKNNYTQQTGKELV